MNWRRKCLKYWKLLIWLFLRAFWRSKIWANQKFWVGTCWISFILANVRLVPLYAESLTYGSQTRVREKPIINDATLDDALNVGINKMATIISNGSDAPATILSQCSPEMLRYYRAADLIISKGQGNYESLSARSENIFFLFKVKCRVIARDSGLDVGSLVLARSTGWQENLVTNSQQTQPENSMGRSDQKLAEVKIYRLCLRRQSQYSITIYYWSKLIILREYTNYHPIRSRTQCIWPNTIPNKNAPTNKLKNQSQYSTGKFRQSHSRDTLVSCFLYLIKRIISDNSFTSFRTEIGKQF